METENKKLKTQEYNKMYDAKTRETRLVQIAEKVKCEHCDKLICLDIN
jgi:hypothetical protein